MTPQQLVSATGARFDRAQECLPFIVAAMGAYEINTPARQAAFLAQVGHESGGLHWYSELWGPTPQQQRYEPPSELATKLGNTQPGDGAKFKGHGLIQVTGRFNHAAARDRIRTRYPDAPDFEAEPEKLAETKWAAISAADFWHSHGLNELADSGDFQTITKRINGGLNGYADRLALYEKAKVAFPATPDAPFVSGEGAFGPSNPGVPDALLSTPKPEKPMPPFLLSVLPSLLGLVPKLGEIFGSGESEVAQRNVKALEVVAGIAKDAVGAANEQDLVQKIQSDPAAAAAVQKAITESWYEIQTNAAGIEEARKVNAASTEFWKQPAIWVTLVCLMPMVDFVIYKVMTDPSYSSEVRSMVVAAVVSGVLSSITGFWLGTSFSSSRKTELANKP